MAMTQRLQNPASAEELFRDAELKGEQGDLSGAFRCLLAGARQGDALSQLALGNCYSAGRGVQKNLQEAARWYKRAYRSGLSAGALNLSVDLQKQGNERGTIAWLTRAAAMDDGDAYVRLAKIYLKRRNGTAAATDLLRKAVSLNRNNISDDTKRQAEALLKRMVKTQSETSQTRS